VLESALRVSAFLAQGLLLREWNDEARLRQGAKALRRVGVEKVYLDVSRGRHADEEGLARARDVLHEFGFQVSGGLTPVAGEDFGERSSEGWWFLCYSSPKTAADVERAARVAARLFDELLVDDLMATDCTCARCEERREGRSWAEFRQRLMACFAKKHIVEAARAEHPEMRVIIKYPQWYDNFHNWGYDVFKHPHNFDGLWVGTETRDREVEYVEPYQAFANYRWLVSVAGDETRVGGGWFDQINCDPPTYLEQAYQTVLAGAPEIALFTPTADYLAPDNPMMEAFRLELPRLRELAAALSGRCHEGIVAYKPRGSDPGDEAYLFDVLGALGLPMAPSAEIGEEARCVVLPVQAAHDRESPKRLRRLVERGATVLLTAGFLSRTANAPEVLALAGVQAPQPVCEWAFEFEAEGKTCRGEGYVPFRWELRPSDAQVLASAQTDSRSFPILTEKQFDNGARVLVLAAKGAEYRREHPLVVPEPLEFVRLANPVVQVLRNRLLAPLGLKFWGPNRVGIYPFSGGLWAIANFRSREAVVEVDDKRWGSAPVWDWLRGLEVEEVEGGRRVCIPPRTTILLAPRGEYVG